MANNQEFSPRMEDFTQLVGRNLGEIMCGPLPTSTVVELAADLQLKITEISRGYHFDWTICNVNFTERETILGVTVTDCNEADTPRYRVCASRCDGNLAIFRVVARVFDKAANLHEMFEKAMA